MAQSESSKVRAKALEKVQSMKDRATRPGLSGFVEFVREQGVIGLAIGLIIGTAVKSVVDSMVTNLVTPILGVLTGGAKFQDKYVCLNHAANNSCINKLTWGNFISSVISFVAIAAIVYFVFKGLKLDRLDRKPDSDKK